MAGITVRGSKRGLSYNLTGLNKREMIWLLYLIRYAGCAETLSKKEQSDRDATMHALRDKLDPVEDMIDSFGKV